MEEEATEAEGVEGIGDVEDGAGEVSGQALESSFFFLINASFPSPCTLPKLDLKS